LAFDGEIIESDQTSGEFFQTDAVEFAEESKLIEIKFLGA